MGVQRCHISVGRGRNEPIDKDQVLFWKRKLSADFEIHLKKNENPTVLVRVQRCQISVWWAPVLLSPSKKRSNRKRSNFILKKKTLREQLILKLAVENQTRSPSVLVMVQRCQISVWCTPVLLSPSKKPSNRKRSNSFLTTKTQISWSWNASLKTEREVRQYWWWSNVARSPFGGLQFSLRCRRNDTIGNDPILFWKPKLRSADLEIRRRKPNEQSVSIGDGPTLPVLRSPSTRRSSSTQSPPLDGRSRPLVKHLSSRRNVHIVECLSCGTST